MTTISIIIPTYNRKELLDITLTNILQQSRPADEIIVIDNESIDGTIGFLKQKYGNRILLASCKRTGGPGSARNLGLRIATGNFIKFFDSDDVMTRNSLETQFELLHASPKGFVYSPYFSAFQNECGEWIAKNDLIHNYFAFSERRPLWHHMMVDGLFIAIPGMLFKKELLNDVGAWREDVAASEDWDYLFRVSLIEPRPVHTNECAFLYRVHGEQITDRQFSDRQRDLDKMTVFTDLFDHFVKNDARFSRFERALFLNRFYQLLRTIHYPGGETQALASYDTFLNKAIWNMLRLRFKIGRIRTGTDWQPAHGPFLSKERINNWLQMGV